MARDLGIDLGTSNVLVYVRRKGIVLNEPSVVALRRRSKQIVAVGGEAEKMIGRTPEQLDAVRPMAGGVISDYTVTRNMLRHFVQRICGARPFRRPALVISVPIGITSVERKSVEDAAREAGAREVHIVGQPWAAAIGAGLPIHEPSGHVVVDIGGGTTDIAVLSLMGMVVSDSTRVAGNRMDECLVRTIKRDHNLMIGDRTAETIKMEIGSAYPDGETKELEIRGRDLIGGLPKTVTISSDEVRLALAEPIAAIIERVKFVLERTPPELSSDILQHGITLTGGGATLRGLDRLLAEETGIPTRVADDPLSCVALGTGAVLEHPELQAYCN